MYVIMMNGYTVCLKTTTARRLSTILKCALIESSYLGGIMDSSGNLILGGREKRHKIIFQLIDIFFSNNIPVIIDSAFAKKQGRDKIYESAHKHNISDVIIIKCICDDEKIAKIRLDERLKTPELSESEVNDINTYRIVKKEYQEPLTDVLPDGTQPSIIKFDTVTFKITKERINPDSIANQIYKHLLNSVVLGELKKR